MLPSYNIPYTAQAVFTIELSFSDKTGAFIFNFYFLQTLLGLFRETEPIGYRESLSYLCLSV